ncbi:hypothetical protein ACFX2G_033622 [Malus domestica]
MASINFNPFESWFHKPPSTSSPSTHSSTAPPSRNHLPISPPSASPTSSTPPPPKPDPKKTIGARAGKARTLHLDAGAVLLGMRERPGLQSRPGSREDSERRPDFRKGELN